GGDARHPPVVQGRQCLQVEREASDGRLWHTSTTDGLGHHLGTDSSRAAAGPIPATCRTDSGTPTPYDFVNGCTKSLEAVGVHWRPSWPRARGGLRRNAFSTCSSVTT